MTAKAFVVDPGAVSTKAAVSTEKIVLLVERVSEPVRMIRCRPIAAALLAGFPLLLALSGCSTAPGYDTAMGTGTGAVIGGLAGGLASRNPLIGLAAALGGGLIGGVIGHQLDEREQQRLTAASAQAAATAPVQTAIPWSSLNATGQVTASGWVLPTSDDYQRDGQVCRNLDQHMVKDGSARDRNVTLCRRVALNDGTSWVVPRN